MTPKKFKDIRKGLGLTQRALAHWIDPHAKNKDRDVRRWEAGDYTVPGSVEVTMLMFKKRDKPEHILKAIDNAAPLVLPNGNTITIRNISNG